MVASRRTPLCLATARRIELNAPSLGGWWSGIAIRWCVGSEVSRMMFTLLSFVSGHGFSRAVGSEESAGFSPCGLRQPQRLKPLTMGALRHG